MNNRCITHNQHHCIHAHECNNPLHSQKLQSSQSKDQPYKKILPSNKPPISTCKSGTIKPQPSSLPRKDRQLPGLQNQLSNRMMMKSVSPDCKNLEFQKMFLNLNQKYNGLLREFEEMRKEKEKQEEVVRLQRIRLGNMEMELEKKAAIVGNYNQMQGEMEKLKDVRKALSVAQNKGLGLEGEIARLKHVIEGLNSEKERVKGQSNKNLKRAEEVEEDFEKESREKENLKRKLQESQSTIEDLQSRYRTLASKNKLNMNDIIDDYEKKLRSLDQKFSFSCDQISDSKRVQTKLKSKIKQLEQELHAQKLKVNSKPKNEHSKVQKQLISLQQKSTKENLRLRETIIEYQHDKRKLEQELSRSNTRWTEEVRQLEKLLAVKNSEIEKLESIKLSSEMEVDILRENKEKRGREKERREEELRGIGREGDHGNDRGNSNGKQRGGNDPSNPPDPEPFGIRGTYSQAVAIRHLQHRNTELQRQVQSLLILKTGNAQTLSINDYNQFQKVIKQNNTHIKDLIQQKVRQIQQNSRLKVQIMQLKNQLTARHSSTSTVTPTHQQYKIREIAGYKNSLSQLQFQLKQIRNENYEINNRYSDYYILKDDNENLKVKLMELAQLVETLKKAVLHNSYEKEALIVDNSQLADHLNFITHLPPRY